MNVISVEDLVSTMVEKYKIILTDEQVTTRWKMPGEDSIVHAKVQGFLLICASPVLPTIISRGRIGRDHPCAW
ncbi:MAG: hypothetical protein ACTSUE_02625 [Promethearchaeota archaeon]